MALVGWALLSSASSLDFVIAAACPIPSSGSLQVHLYFPLSVNATFR
jgi:hypothetical protein